MGDGDGDGAATTGGAGALDGTGGDLGVASGGLTGTGAALGTGGDVGTGGTVATGGAGGAPLPPVDCSGISSAGYDLCDSTNDTCGAVFTDSSGCSAVCAAAGLECVTAYENDEEMCAADMALPALACDSGHQSDYCLCGRPTGGGTGGTSSGGSGSGGAASGGASSGGTSSGGGTGLPTVPDNGCNVLLTDTPVGYASQNGGTIGGGSATPILVTTESELQSYLGDGSPRVLYVMNDLDFRTANRDGVPVCRDNSSCDNGSGVQVDNARVSNTCDASEYASTSYRYETSISVASNKTVIGIGAGDGASIRGATFNIGSSSQVIFRNLRIYDVNPHLVEAGDGFTLQGASHIWLDHLLIEEISDGYADIGSTSGSTFDDNITLSYIHFNGRTDHLCGGKHNFVNFVDNGHATYHHNFFDNGSGRNPKLGGPNTNVHLFNNYWLGITYFCITAQQDAEARVESNYFENSSRPHWLQTDGNGTAGIAIDAGNIYTGASSGNTNRDTGGSVFSVPYSYTKQTAAEARQEVLDCAGPQPIR